MGRTKVTQQQRIKEFQGHGFVASKNKFKLFCTYCNEDVSFDRKSIVENHIKSGGHVRRAAATTQQPGIRQAINSQVDQKFKWRTMTTAFASAGVPLFVFRNEQVRNWIKDNVKQGGDLPSEFTLRKYLTEEGIKDIEETRKICEGKDLLVMVDETQDFRTRKILNILIMPAEPGKKFRVALTEIIGSCSCETVIQKIIKAFQLLQVPVERAVALISDNATYMMAAGKVLRSMNSRCIHSTCWAHILHLVAEEIRSSMKTADRFISQVKSCLIKAPSRRQALLGVLERNNCAVKLPPVPVLTRWTTWLEAGSYHYQNFTAIKEWINESAPDSAAMRELKLTVNEETLAPSLNKIHIVYPGLSKAIKTLEGNFVLACDVYTILETCKCLIEEQLGHGSAKFEKYWSGKDQHPALEFWRSVQILDPRKFKLNPTNEIPASLAKFSISPVPVEEFVTYKALCGQISEGTTISAREFWRMYSSEMPTLSSLAFRALSVPASSAEVERSFSVLKKLLRPDRNRLTEENIGVHLRIMFNTRQANTEEISESSDEDED